MKGYRKFIVVMTALVFTFIVAMVGKCTTEFASVVTLVAGAYLGAHAIADRNIAQPPVPNA